MMFACVHILGTKQSHTDAGRGRRASWTCTTDVGCSVSTKRWPYSRYLTHWSGTQARTSVNAAACIQLLGISAGCGAIHRENSMLSFIIIWLQAVKQLMKLVTAVFIELSSALHKMSPQRALNYHRRDSAGRCPRLRSWCLGFPVRFWLPGWSALY